MKSIIALLIFFSSAVFACEKNIPIEVKWAFDKKPVENKPGYLMILAPLKYEGWSLGVVNLKKGENSIPIMKYESEQEFPGKALFEITATLEFLKETRFTVSYTPDAVKLEDGTTAFMPCVYFQEIKIEI